MLNDAFVYATVAVSDIEAAKKFYGDTLGLNNVSENPGGVSYTCGASKLFVYQSEHAGTNKATAATWDVGDVDAVAAELKSRGVVFEQYDIPGATVEGDVYVMGDMRAAWFKDPTGNVLCIGNAH